MLHLYFKNSKLVGICYDLVMIYPIFLQIDLLYKIMIMAQKKTYLNKPVKISFFI